MAVSVLSQQRTRGTCTIGMAKTASLEEEEEEEGEEEEEVRPYSVILAPQGLQPCKVL